MTSTESISIVTRTIGGRGLRLRDLRLRDFTGLVACIKDPRFSYPLLTGTPDPIKRPLRPLRRAFAYALVCATANASGWLLFGARRHWIISILDAESDQFLGAVMLDGVIREESAKGRIRIGEGFVKRPERRLDLRPGDGELGFFLHPNAQGQGIASQAAYVLLDRLSRQSNTASSYVLRRVWAETGANNLAAQTLLRRIGLLPRPDLRVSAGNSRRYERDGTPITLLHFDQPREDIREAPYAPVRARVQHMLRKRLAQPEWQNVEA
jgi:RimJ/RimL family protein N-acetyltransferase